MKEKHAQFVLHHSGSELVFNSGELDIDLENSYMYLDQTETRKLYEAMKEYYEHD